MVVVAARRIRKVERKDAAPGCSRCVAIWGALKCATQAEGDGRGAMMEGVRIEMGSLAGATLHGLTLIGDGDGVRPVRVRRLEASSRSPVRRELELAGQARAVD